MEVFQTLLTPNKYSRPQTKIVTVKYIVIHWVGNAGSTARANYNYFENAKNKKTYVSAHYIIGLEGEILWCIPETEIAYHAKEANSYSIGIENCQPGWDGKFNSKTYASLIKLCAYLCIKYDLNPEEALLRHYDVTQKVCPKYYVNHPEEWDRLKWDVKKAMTTSVRDKELLEAVNGMIASGIKIDPKVWGSISTMNMKYTKVMVERIGYKFGKTTYKSTIDFLLDTGCILSSVPWEQYDFRPEWCRTLILRVYEMLIMPNQNKK